MTERKEIFKHRKLPSSQNFNKFPIPIISLIILENEIISFLWVILLKTRIFDSFLLKRILVHSRSLSGKIKKMNFQRVASVDQTEKSHAFWDKSVFHAVNLTEICEDICFYVVVFQKFWVSRQLIERIVAKEKTVDRIVLLNQTYFKAFR